MATDIDAVLAEFRENCSAEYVRDVLTEFDNLELALRIAYRHGRESGAVQALLDRGVRPTSVVWAEITLDDCAALVGYIEPKSPKWFAALRRAFRGYDLALIETLLRRDSDEEPPSPALHRILADFAAHSQHPELLYYVVEICENSFATRNADVWLAAARSAFGLGKSTLAKTFLATAATYDCRPTTAESRSFVLLAAESGSWETLCLALDMRARDRIGAGLWTDIFIASCNQPDLTAVRRVLSLAEGQKDYPPPPWDQALVTAARNGHVEIAEFAIAQGANNFDDALRASLVSTDNRMAHLLLERGARFRSEAIKYICVWGWVEFLDRVPEDTPQPTLYSALLEGASQGHPHVFRHFLRQIGKLPEPLLVDLIHAAASTTVAAYSRDNLERLLACVPTARVTDVVRCVQRQGGGRLCPRAALLLKSKIKTL